MHLLLVENQTDDAAALSRDLASLGHSVVIARDGRDALFFAGDQMFDAIVLDRMLPLVDGVDVVRRLRDSANPVPVLMVSALGDLRHRLEELDSGADDYVVKPAAAAEIHARLLAILRRAVTSAAPAIIKVREIEIDLLNQTVSYGDMPIRLKPIEFRILRELARHAGEVLTRSMLLESVWGYHFEPDSNIVDMHIAKLRSQLRFAGLDNVITTVRNSGYIIRG